MIPKSLVVVATLATALCTALPAHASDTRVWGTLHVGLPIPVLPRIELHAVPVHLAPGWRDRDRDGIPDWRDRHDNRRHRHHGWAWRADRDHDGIPDWRDHRDNRHHGWHDDRPWPRHDRGHGHDHGHGHDRGR